MLVSTHLIDKLALDSRGVHLATGAGMGIRIWRRNNGKWTSQVL